MKDDLLIEAEALVGPSTKNVLLFKHDLKAYSR